MPDGDLGAFTLGTFLTTSGAAAPLVLIVVQMLKVLLPNWPEGRARQVTFLVTVALVGWAYFDAVYWQHAMDLTPSTVFLALIAVLATSRLAMALYDDVAARPNSLTGLQVSKAEASTLLEGQAQETIGIGRGEDPLDPLRDARTDSTDLPAG